MNNEYAGFDKEDCIFEGSSEDERCCITGTNEICLPRRIERKEIETNRQEVSLRTSLSGVKRDHGYDDSLNCPGQCSYFDRVWFFNELLSSKRAQFVGASLRRYSKF